MLSPSIIRYLQYYNTTTVPQASQAQHSTAQRSQPAQQAAKQVRADHSAATQACRRSWLAPACRRAYIQIAVSSKRTNKSTYARPTKAWWCDARRVCLYTVLFSPSFLFLPYMRRPGCFGGPWSAWHLQLLVCTYNIGTSTTSVSPIHSSLWASVAGGPPAVRSALYILLLVYRLRHSAATWCKKANTCGSNTRARATFTRTRFLVYGFRLLGGAFFAGAHVTGTRRAGPAKPLPER